MRNQNRLSIFSSAQRDLWREVESSIWSSDGTDPHGDPARSVLKTLLDQPRWLETFHLYDDRGSQLFEKICELPEYYLTRTESAILVENAAQIIRLAPVECIVELGAGTSKKTLHLLKEQIAQGRGGAFAPVDVSLPSLRIARDIVKDHFPELDFHGLLGQYQDGIACIEKHLPTLFVFLGSTVGNFNRSEFVRFFQHLSESMGPNDYFLLGVDRVKETSILETAYADSEGITAEFILNVFEHINRILDTNFDRRKMRYHSWYNPDWQQVEMYAVSAESQKIQIPWLETSFVWEKGDKILVEISRKFEPDRLQEQLRCFGLRPVSHFTDEENWFSLLLFGKN
ncbi:MAG TPA: L-histidine N(alpha)-methyltransferase [Candidatus Binatia bacterium]|jgi:dimethylhistidine N-methyltransferase|nr:L-histidine N(alpha)-methyltransferase [Candidatus Binatia bacterium]